jgi:hypothetical protein
LCPSRILGYIDSNFLQRLAAIDDVEGGIVRIYTHKFLANSFILIVYAFSLRVHDVAVEGFKVLCLWSQFVSGVLCLTYFVHLGEEYFVLVVYFS